LFREQHRVRPHHELMAPPLAPSAGIAESQLRTLREFNQPRASPAQKIKKNRLYPICPNVILSTLSPNHIKETALGPQQVASTRHAETCCSEQPKGKNSATLAGRRSPARRNAGIRDGDSSALTLASRNEERISRVCDDNGSGKRKNTSTFAEHQHQ